MDSTFPFRSSSPRERTRDDLRPCACRCGAVPAGVARGAGRERPRQDAHVPRLELAAVSAATGTSSSATASTAIPTSGTATATVFARAEALGLRFVGPQHPNGRQAEPWPDELPTDSRCVPTFHHNRQTPATATRQLDFVFASRSLADAVSVRAMNAVDEWVRATTVGPHRRRHLTPRGFRQEPAPSDLRPGHDVRFDGAVDRRRHFRRRQRLTGRRRTLGHATRTACSPHSTGDWHLRGRAHRRARQPSWGSGGAVVSSGTSRKPRATRRSCRWDSPRLITRNSTLRSRHASAKACRTLAQPAPSQYANR